jgi:hypothetical protein
MKSARFLGLTLMLAAASAYAAGSTPTASGDMTTRVWHDIQGRTVQATFRGIEGENVLLQTANGAVSAVPLSRLSAEDQKFARSIKLPEAAPASTNPAPAAAETDAPKVTGVLRTWHVKEGGSVQATFRGVENDYIYLQTANGVVAPVALERLTDEDQEIAKTLKPEGLGIPSDPYLPAFAQKIDDIVEMGLKAHNEKPNALASDEQFVRRVYLDLVGRIPTREETMEFLADTSSSKRAKVIDKLVNSDGFTSRMFNYFADMLRMSDDAQKAKFFTYEEWFKTQLKMNRPWNEIVFDMMTANGKLLDNGAAGYLLRDKGMRLDNLSLTLSTFLGANVACAQCHDHPFADWTQRQFYQMAAFFGTTETYDKGGKGKGKGKGGGGNEIMKEAGKLSQQDQRKLRRLVQVNALDVHETGHNEVALPDDYRYKDGHAGDIINPQLIKWSPTTDVQKFDVQSNPTQLILFQRKRDDLYAKTEAAVAPKKGAENPREAFAKWMTSPDNPRFAMTIANRMWKLMFGVGVKEPINDLDNPNDANNPVLLGHLANEMVRVKFDLRAFLRLLCNTQTYQREAITKMVTPGEPYYFPGPILRRMSSEQAWDSCVTLAIGEKVDGYKLHRAANYVEAMELKPGMSGAEILAKLEMSGRGGGNGKGKGNGKNANMKKLPDSTGDEDDVDHKRPEVLMGLVLARASELPQPDKDQHFLRMFGQSDRQIADSGADEGSIPQVLMLMNGEAQNVLRSPKSRVLATAIDQKSPSDQVTSLYLSFFSRHPTATELKDGSEALKSGMSVSDLTWVLFNTREFVFVQ